MSKAAVHTKPANTHNATRSNASTLQRQHSLGAHVCIQREASELGVQPHAPALVRQVINSPGQPLDPETRSLMEPRLGHDFSGVRVHTDREAAESARAISANAYTAGEHVAFAPGRYSPGTVSGLQLIAHELMHVAQQAEGPVAGTPVGGGVQVSHPEDRFERSAECRNENASVHNRAQAPVSSSFTNDVFVQRQIFNTGTASDIGAFGALAGIGAGIWSAISAERQADIAKEALGVSKDQLSEAREQNRVGRLALGVSERQAEAAENPPVPVPTTGGIVINNGSGHGDIQSSTAPKGTAAKEGNETESRWQLLRVSQGRNNFATFVATIRHNGRDILGGNFEDGESKGYLGGSEGSNLSLSLKATPAAAVPGPRPKSPIASVRILASGTNSTPRTRDGRQLPGYQLQRFSGNIRANAAGGLDAPPFSVNPGGQPQVTGDGKSMPVVDINLENTSGPATPPVSPEWEAGVRPGTSAATGGSRK